MKEFTLQDLNEIIGARALENADVSYTSTLLSAGTQKCAKKFGEEAVEAVIAAMSGDRVELVKESADVLYHLLVLIKSQGVMLEDVMMELERRTAQSGHAEKASRPQS
ncbi:MAG: phosphoribosyl-ATP diphosphatase [Pseudomonadota bacterium]